MWLHIHAGIKVNPSLITTKHLANHVHNSWLVSYICISCLNLLHCTTRWVDGTPTSEVTPVILVISGSHCSSLDNTATADFPPSIKSVCLNSVLGHSDHFGPRYSKFPIWTWKFKVKVMAKVELHCPIWSLEFNRYVCFLFRDNWTISGWDIANSIFDLENWKSRSRWKSTKL